MIRDYVMFMLIGICGVLMMFSFITKSISRRRKYALTSMAFIAILLLVADKLTRVFDGDSAAYWIARMSKFIVYSLFLMIILVFNVYLKDFFLHEGHAKDVPKRLKSVDWIVALGETILIISRYNNFYYAYVNNSYQRSRWYIIAYIWPLVALIIQLSVILQHNKKFRRLLLLPLVMFIIAPIGAAVLQVFVHGASMVTSTIVSMVVLLYAYSIIDTNRLLEKAHKQEVQMLLDKQENIKLMVSETTSALVEAIEAKDAYTKGHSKRVAKYARMLAEKAGKSQDECDEIYLIGLLHDVGKIGIPDTIITKDCKLTDEEYQIIQIHPTIGKEILDKITISPNLSVGAIYHHERYDGMGYPTGLKGEEIPEIARLIAVADTYDAMASKRSYRDVLPQSKVREEIAKGSGTQFDPVYAKLMLEIIDADTEYELKQKTEKTKTIKADTVA